MNTLNQRQTENQTQDHQKRAENHKLTAAHLEAAAKHHHEAARLYIEGAPEKAAHSSLVASGHLTLAKEIQKNESTWHALASDSISQLDGSLPIAAPFPIK